MLYKLTFPNGKAYIGITSKTAARRRIVHLHHARKGRPGALQAAIRKYGDFEMIVLLVAGDWDFLCEMERRAIVAFGTRAPFGYNLTDGGEGILGVPRTPEQRAKCSTAHKLSGHRPPYSKGWNHTSDARIKIAAAGKGRIFSEESRAKIGATKIGNKYNVGRPCSEEKKAKISAAQKGRKMPESRRQKMIGKKRTPEQIAAMSLAAKGKPWTAARRAAEENRKQRI